MITSYRHQFNTAFTPDRYRSLLEDIESKFTYKLPFRVAETPIFLSRQLKEEIVQATKSVIDFVHRDNFMELTAGSIPNNQNVPNEPNHVHFYSIDFGIVEEHGTLVPKLIEAQGFPSLLAFQPQLARAYKRHYPEIPRDWTCYFDVNEESYTKLFHDIILADRDPKEVVLIDIEPTKQHTHIDFLWTHESLGIPILCVSDIWSEGRHLYYHSPEGEKIQIKRIYNRCIFDELNQRPDLELKFSFFDDLDVTWVTHPNYFNRISKYMLPLMDETFVPKSFFLNDLDRIPSDLDNYVLKPLYSFSGSGIVFDINPEDLTRISDLENYILQEKVSYAPVIQSPTGNVKCEIRVMVMCPEDGSRPKLALNLVRLSKGKMVGVKYNQNFDWVGGSVAFFEP